MTPQKSFTFLQLKLFVQCSTKSHDFQRGDRIVSGDNQSTVEQRAGQRFQHQVNSPHSCSAGPTIRITLMRILILCVTLHFDADPDPDPAFYFDAIPDPDPRFQINAQSLGKVLKQAHFPPYILSCHYLSVIFVCVRCRYLQDNRTMICKRW